MTKNAVWLSSLAAVALGFVGCAANPPAATGYRFEAVDTQVRPSRDAEVRVRLIRMQNNQPVPGATIYEHRFEMWMSGYKVITSNMVEGRTGPPILAIDEGSGVYRVHAQLPMAGDWQATLVARVPGETLPIRERVSILAR